MIFSHLAKGRVYINKFINLTPGESSWRIIIIDESENLNRNAENALLKYIEEPPDRTLFLLVTNSVTKLLPTTRSRCRQLTLKPLDPSDVKKFLLQLEICSKINSSDLDILVEFNIRVEGSDKNRSGTYQDKVYGRCYIPRTTDDLREEIRLAQSKEYYGAGKLGYVWAATDYALSIPSWVWYGVKDKLTGTSTRSVTGYDPINQSGRVTPTSRAPNTVR